MINGGRTRRLQAPLASEVGAWLHATFGPDRNVVEQALVMAEEVGELAAALGRRASVDVHRGFVAEFARLTGDVAEEMGDVLIAAWSVAATEGIEPDLAAVIRIADEHDEPRGEAVERPVVIAAGKVFRAVVKRAQKVRGDDDYWTTQIEMALRGLLVEMVLLARAESLDITHLLARRWAKVQNRDAVGVRAPDAAAR
jgi:NTP pyrophosphatase (non-canonical NTP hydrolase)